MKTNKKFLLLAIVAIAVIVIVPLFGLLVAHFVFGWTLIKDYEVHEDGFFQYIVMGEHSRYPQSNSAAIVAIVGFTESGKKQAVIDIPREIDGKPVRYIGYNDQTGREYYNVYSENLRKIYVHDNIDYIINFENLYEHKESEISLMLCSVNEKIFFDAHHFKNIYYYGDKIDDIKDRFSASPANIVFMNNYSSEINNGYYRLDNINAGEKIPIPPKPERKECEFVGWYTEPECINVWDFNVSPALNEDTEFKLYAG